jgi:hypothetical protein
VILYVQFWSKIFSRVNISISNKEIMPKIGEDFLDFWREFCCVVYPPNTGHLAGIGKLPAMAGCYPVGII